MLQLAAGCGGTGKTTAVPATTPTSAWLKVHYPRPFTLTDSSVAYWAGVVQRSVAYARPSRSARVVATLSTRTSDQTDNIVLVLGGAWVSPTGIWYHVRLPILPNNSTGWVPLQALGDLYPVHTHLYVNRKTLTARLTRDGRTIFKTAVDIGRSYWPTPAGQFYIRDKFTHFNEPVYGPIVFGTSARSTTLTDWPGGGFIGVHGTNNPGIHPGRVSHGCVRMRNSAILRLARLMPVGTPLTII